MTKEVAQLIIQRISTEELCKVYDESCIIRIEMDVMHEALVRGWIMAELKTRDLKKYRMWMKDKGNSPTAYFVESE